MPDSRGPACGPLPLHADASGDRGVVHHCRTQRRAVVREPNGERCCLTWSAPVGEVVQPCCQPGYPGTYEEVVLTAELHHSTIGGPRDAAVHRAVP